MARIAFDDASTHGKFISYNKKSNQKPSDCQFSCRHSTITPRYILAKHDAPITSSVALIRWSLGDHNSKKQNSRFPITSRRTVWLCFFGGDTNLLRDSGTKTECPDLRVEPKNPLLRVRMLHQ